jgi:aspartyl protease family protein
MPGALGLAALLAAAAFLIATKGERDVAGLAPEQFAALVSTGALLLVVASGVARQFHGRFADGVRALAVWAVLGVALVAGYSYRDLGAGVADRLLGELAPGRPAVGPGGEVTITRRSDGSFSVAATVDGHAQRFAFDTGASTVVLSAETAGAMGIRPQDEAYTVTVHTANGRARAAPIVIDTLAVGPIVARRVPALVTRPGALTTNLLGMTFLERLASYEVRGNRLILRGT